MGYDVTLRDEGEHMWSACHPKSEDELNECAQLGKSLSRLTQPSILAVLAQSDKPMHGYLIIQEIAGGPMFGGNAPDPTGVYRILKQMENNNLVESEWDTSESGPAKRCYTLTDAGKACLRRWVDSLACYAASIEDLRVIACDALGIDVPALPTCVPVVNFEPDAEQQKAAEEAKQAEERAADEAWDLEQEPDAAEEPSE